MIWALRDAAARMGLEEELKAGNVSDDRFYDIIFELTGSQDEAERYLYERMTERSRRAVAKAMATNHRT